MIEGEIESKEEMQEWDRTKWNGITEEGAETEGRKQGTRGERGEERTNGRKEGKKKWKGIQARIQEKY